MTVTPRGESSMRRESKKPCRACLDAESEREWEREEEGGEREKREGRREINN